MVWSFRLVVLYWVDFTAPFAQCGRPEAVRTVETPQYF